MEDPGLLVNHLLYKAALVVALLRWAFCWALKCWSLTRLPSPENDSLHLSQPAPSPQQIRDGLILTTFREITYRIPPSCDTCIVCLTTLNEEDEVRELRNCCHVFHKECIDRWVDHEHEHGHDQHVNNHDQDDNHKACPLCRAPLLTSSQGLAWTNRCEPSWAVERILYLFGDDLLM